MDITDQLDEDEEVQNVGDDYDLRMFGISQALPVPEGALDFITAGERWFWSNKTSRGYC